MIVVLAAVVIALWFIGLVILAVLGLIVAPYTGFPYLETLTFWNWFWTAFLVSSFTGGSAAAAVSK